MERFCADTPLKKEEKYQLAKSLNISQRKLEFWFYHKHVKEKGEKSFSKCQWSFAVLMYNGQ